MASADQLIEVFNEAKARPVGAERDLFLAEACRDEPALKEQVLSLLQAHEGAGDFLINTQAIPSVTVLTEKPGDKIGRYKLLQKIGEGGCGVVYMAEQEEPVRRRVALKVIKLGMDTRQVVARFEAERQALAMMDHPNIAKIFDAGITDTPLPASGHPLPVRRGEGQGEGSAALDPRHSSLVTSSGRPFFVMELVRGIKITEYCDQNNLPTEERLKLFTQVCHAIQHAHQKGIIHRDIKPSNILVTVNDGVPVPKVIDFGIAKAIEQRLTDKTVFTAFEQFIGTPAYMSPEQAEMTSLDIDTRADIYSLGVLLYELLSGNTPFDAQKLVASGVAEIRRIIREQEPPKPSTRLNTLNDADLSTVAQRRHTDPPKLIHLLRGDLDWIVMKCLEKDRTRRYETANGLATDLQRHLDNEPVIARPPSNLYRFQKLVRRNKLAFGAVAAVTTVLLLGVVASSWQALRATRAEHEQIRLREAADAEKKQAQTEAARSKQVAQFLKDVLSDTGPSVARGRDATVLRRETLDKAAQRVEKEFKGQPEVQADLWMTLGNTYLDIGEYPHAVTNFERAVVSYSLALGSESTKLALALGYLGRCQSFIGKVAMGKTNAQLGLDLARRCGDSETLATCLLNMGRSLNSFGQVPTNGAPYLREAVTLQKQLGNNPVALADCIRFLAGSLRHDESGERELLASNALALHRQYLGPDHPNVASGEFLIGQFLLEQGKLKEAEETLRKTVALYRKIHDPNHPHQVVVLKFLVKAMTLQGKVNEAEGVIRQAAQASPSHAGYLTFLGGFNAWRGEWSAAAEHISRAIELNPNNENILFTKAVMLLQTGRLEDYRQQCHELLARAADRRNFVSADEAARVSLLLPVEGADFARACELADFAATAERTRRYDPWAHLCRALCDYRRGRFDSANNWAVLAVSDEEAEFPCKAAARFIQASAHARLHQFESARVTLAKGEELLKERPVDIPRDPEQWVDWTIGELLRREAKALIEDQPSASGGQHAPK